MSMPSSTATGVLSSRTMMDDDDDDVDAIDRHAV
jgi:hypothetical protein